MSTPVGPERRSRLIRPQVALPIIAGAVIIVALMTPEATGGRTGDSRLTSRSTEPQAASALYELAERLGWKPSRRLVDSIPLGDSTAIQMVLDPPIALSALETHAVLDRVRRGGALLYVLGGGAMADSLGVGEQNEKVTVARRTRMYIAGSGTLVAENVEECDDHESVLTAGLPFWPDRQTHLFALRWRGAPPSDSRALATVRMPNGIASGDEPAVVGFPLGRGRVAIVADPDLLRNDVLRVCDWGADVAAVRILEYLSDDGPGGQRRERIVFDEYHQGYGDQPGTVRGIVRYLGRTPSGHLILQLAGAGLVLLLAVGPRLLVPRAAERIERRSPLEHVDALAAAYRAVGASRTATSRLVHGVRRRVEHALGGRTGATSDTAFLDWAQERVPDRSSDVALVRSALTTPTTRRELEVVGQALRRLELSLTSFPRSS